MARIALQSSALRAHAKIAAPRFLKRLHWQRIVALLAMMGLWIPIIAVAKHFF
jgi:hypothetical protein